ncbi:MAG TPA: glycoside hydrolase family 38 C-terminal domain-containing protein [Streptosporangiaceae bacterium]|jgi:alpha-mannosidase
MRIQRADATPLFVSTGEGPRQVVRVTLADVPAAADATTPAPVTVRVEGPGVTTRHPARIDDRRTGAGPAAETEVTAEVPITVAAPHGPGSALQVTVIAADATTRAEHATEITVAEPGWTMWLICHFHYDPVWWNTQGSFTQTQLLLPDENGKLPEVRTAFELVRRHLDAARDDPDYKFVLAEVDYLKPYFDVHPEDRAELRDLIAASRVELVGGAYNEPNTNLTSAESTIRNIIYGLGHQHGVLGADPSVAWALDAFGHDPSYPGLMAAAGMTASGWARGPFHQWGPWRTVGDNRRMQFASEFEWLSPDGQGLLTSYMANHYGAGWGLHQAADLPAAMAEALTQLTTLAPVAATRNVLLPVGADHVIPARWATAVHREFAARYAWPRCITGLPREFFAAVRAEAAERGVWLTPQTRDMNPVYPGKDVSYIDTKQAQRAAEVAVSDGERLGTLAWLAGGDYPAESLDKAWRQLVFGAHHDAITGTESDQVYLDLLGGWREAFERGAGARQAAARFLAGQIKTIPPNGSGGEGSGSGRPVAVFNTLSWPRTAMASVNLSFEQPGTAGVALADDSGAAVPFNIEGARRHPDGSLAGLTVTFPASVPALGYRTYWVRGTPEAADVGWVDVPGTVIGNEAFEIEADPRRGGTLRRILDRRSGTALLGGPGNELVLQEEYGSHPRWGEGPWLLSPKRAAMGSGGTAARVRAQRCPVGSRLVAEFQLGDLRVSQETTLWDGAPWVDFRTHVDGSIGQDRLLRVRFPTRVTGGLPVFGCAASVVGRTFGVADLDAAEHAFTLDNPAHEWFGVGATARVRADGQAWAFGVAELVLPAEDAAPAGEWRAAVRDLVAALASAGVTVTCSRGDGPRYGALDLDSNLPDARIAVGGPEVNTWSAALLAALGPAGDGVAARLAAPGGARVWVPAAKARAEVFTPGADVRGERDLPALVVSGGDLLAAVRDLARDLADATVDAEPVSGDLADGPAPDRLLADHSVALLNRGTPSSLVTPDGTLHIGLMRASSAWPCGVWIDGAKRAAPDGSSFAWQHWSHTFRYALAAGAGDWRDAGFVLAGQEYNHDLIACETSRHDGPLPPSASLAEVASPGQARPAAMLSALKPRGNPLAAGRPGRPGRDGGVTVRLRDAGIHPAPAPVEVSLLGGIAAARLSDLTEGTDGGAADVAAGRARVTVPPAGTVSLTVTPVAGDGPLTSVRPAASEDAAGGAEPAQPVFTRYWLHGKGPAPAGNLPATVHLSPSRVTLAQPATGANGDGDHPAPGQPGPNGPAPRGRLSVSVACGPAGASGQVLLDVPPGLAVARLDDQPAEPLRYSLAGGEFARWDLSVQALPGTGAGRYFLAARILDELGQVLEDSALVTIGEPPEPDVNLPTMQFLPLFEADQRALESEIEVELRPGALDLAPGECARLTVRLANRTASEVRGECQLVSPFGSWQETSPWTRGFAAAPGETVRLDYTVALPATARPGSHWWALAKLMYFGRVRYTDPAEIRVTG